MSRILDALRKHESGEQRVAAPLPRARETRETPPDPAEKRAPVPGHPAESPAPTEGSRKSHAAPFPPQAHPTVAPTPPPSAPSETPERTRPQVRPELVTPPEPHGAQQSTVPTLPTEVWTRQGLPAIPQAFQKELSSLRLQLDTALTGRHPRVVMFVSSTGGEGNSTVAASFARVVARDTSARVLLLDANARRPGLTLYFGLPDGPGLPEILYGDNTFEDSVHVVERENLHVLTTYPGQNVSENMYAQQRVRAFLNHYGTRYDYVILDAPPVLESPETTVLGGVVDTSLLVVRAAHTKSGVVNRAVDTLAKAGVPVLGVVLNRRRHDIPDFLYKRI